jgi:hypothetical protein
MPSLVLLCQLELSLRVSFWARVIGVIALRTEFIAKLHFVAVS